MEGNTTPNTGARCINEERPVYFSYARNSNKRPEWEHISDCVDKLLGTLDANNIEYRLDKRDIGAGDRISDFEREIGWKSEVVVLVFSDKYFRSMHCMYEFVQIKKSLSIFPNKRLLCIKSGDMDLSDIKYIMELERFWGNMKQDYEAIEYHRLRAHSGTEKAAFENGFYMEDIRNLYSFFSAINYANAKNEDWSDFVDDIKKYYIKNPVPNRQTLVPPPEEQPVTQTEVQPKNEAQSAAQSQPEAQPKPAEQPRQATPTVVPPKHVPRQAAQQPKQVYATQQPQRTQQYATPSKPASTVQQHKPQQSANQSQEDGPKMMSVKSIVIWTIVILIVAMMLGGC
ncbi:MAG: toll/interleukin-1 receptor domain-containing protein [Bacteroidales bacterium]|nr:toll/interleukin-1 receptor domain-containing protein [Bacteroidales bacterium]